MKLSIVIPVLDEAARLPALLRALKREPCDGTEIIVVDGGSSDGSPDAARGLGATVIEGYRGRGQQLAAGTRAARGEAILFLHADTVLPPNAAAQIEEALVDPAVVGGNFALTFDGADRFSRWLDGFYAWLRGNGFYYGDSAIFIRRDVLARIGGIRPISLMEDHDLVRRMERAGRTVCLDRPGAVTSSRRFDKRHPLGIVWQWTYLHVLYHAGISPDLLARLYRSARHSPGRN
jgi:rSAM/selenodomain-associated transferase 2